MLTLPLLVAPQWIVENFGVATLFPQISIQFFGIFSIEITRPIHEWLISFFGSMLTHANFWHWFGNASMMLVTGQYLQTKFTTRQLWVAYVLTGLGAHVAFFATNPLAGCLGASGALFGLMAIAACLLRGPLACLFILRLVIELVMFAEGGGGVAHMAHVGGAVTGFLLLAIGSRK